MELDKPYACETEKGTERKIFCKYRCDLVELWKKKWWRTIKMDCWKNKKNAPTAGLIWTRSATRFTRRMMKFATGKTPSSFARYRVATWLSSPGKKNNFFSGRTKSGTAQLALTINYELYVYFSQRVQDFLQAKLSADDMPDDGQRYYWLGYRSGDQWTIHHDSLLKSEKWCLSLLFR